MAQVRFAASDGLPLGGLFYPAAGAPKQVAVLHGGAGISAIRYRRFAGFLAESGISTLTYDYRGVGLSRPARLRGFRVSTADWVEYDSAAAIGWMRQRFPQAELIGISHSIGGLAAAASPQAGKQDRLVFIAPHTGYYGDYRAAYRVPLALLWHVVMPVITRVAGFFPASRLGLGDDIPAGVALEWSRRRAPDLRRSGIATVDVRTSRLLDRAAGLTRPALSLTVSDDAFATAIAAERLFSYFPGLAPQHLLVRPADAAVRRLGHFGYFRRQPGSTLWPRLIALMDRDAIQPRSPTGA